MLFKDVCCRGALYNFKIGSDNVKSENYVIFDILGIKSGGAGNSFGFTENAVCEINRDPFIAKIMVNADISNATFSLHDSLEITNENAAQIVNYLYLFLGNMMVSLLKNSSQYSNAALKPDIRLCETHFSKKNKIRMEFTENISIRETFSFQCRLCDGSAILKRWVGDATVLNYKNEQDRYDILFLLLQSGNRIQKYMAMYAYLLSLVREISSNRYERQKDVVQYVIDNCSKSGIQLVLSPSTRPGAKPTDMDDQFTSLRNKIGHPSDIKNLVSVSEADINGLASIICCAIENVAL